jgi:hypothetical protein
MREIRSYGSVGERGGNEPLYPEREKRRSGEVVMRVAKSRRSFLFLLSSFLILRIVRIQ